MLWLIKFSCDEHKTFMKLKPGKRKKITAMVDLQEKKHSSLFSSTVRNNQKSFLAVRTEKMKITANVKLA